MLFSLPFLSTLFLKDFPNKSEGGVVKRNCCPSRLLSRRPKSTRIPYNCLDSLSVCVCAFDVVVWLSSKVFISEWLLWASFWLTGCLPTLCGLPSITITACVCMCVYVQYFFLCTGTFHNKLSPLYALCCSMCKTDLFSLGNVECIIKKSHWLSGSSKTNLQSADVFQLHSSCRGMQYFCCHLVTY